MTEISHQARVEAWHLDLMQQLNAQRKQWAAEAAERAARPPALRRRPKAWLRFRPAGPADAAEQARQAEHARRLAEAREDCLIKLEMAAMDIVRMTAG